jgi:hypothetical protein
MTTKPKATKVTPPTSADPLNVNARLYRQISKLLDDLEKKPKYDDDGNITDGVTTRERIAGLVAIARIQTVFVGLRKEIAGGRGSAGSAVRKYSKAFDAVGRRKARAGTAAVADELPADTFVDDDDDSDAA